MLAECIVDQERAHVEITRAGRAHVEARLARRASRRCCAIALVARERVLVEMIVGAREAPARGKLIFAAHPCRLKDLVSDEGAVVDRGERIAADCGVPNMYKIGWVS